jgi:hypothetical protein
VIGRCVSDGHDEHLLIRERNPIRRAPGLFTRNHSNNLHRKALIGLSVLAMAISQPPLVASLRGFPDIEIALEFDEAPMLAAPAHNMVYLAAGVAILALIISAFFH